MYTRGEVLKMYARFLYNRYPTPENRYLASLSVHSSGQARMILEPCLTLKIFNQHPLDEDCVWKICGLIQRNQYILFGMIVNDDQVPCYLCSQMVDDKWKQITLFPDCQEYFNIRIACTDCAQKLGDKNPFEYMKINHYPNQLISLARREKVTLFSTAFHNWFQYYRGGTITERILQQQI